MLGLAAARSIALSPLMGWGSWDDVDRKMAAWRSDVVSRCRSSLGSGGGAATASRPKKTSYTCGWCGARNAGKKCGGCGEVHYCGRECQVVQ